MVYRPKNWKLQIFFQRARAKENYFRFKCIDGFKIWHLNLLFRTCLHSRDPNTGLFQFLNGLTCINRPAMVETELSDAYLVSCTISDASDELVPEQEKWTLAQHCLSCLWRSIYLYLGMRKPNWQSSSNQSGLTTQIRTRPRATQQGRIKCRHHVTVPAVPTQEAIPEEGW